MGRLTVLICTHDREQLLAKALASLNSPERPAGWAVDILVAANACRDGTHDMLDAYRQDGRERGRLSPTSLADAVLDKQNTVDIARLDGAMVAARVTRRGPAMNAVHRLGASPIGVRPFSGLGTSPWKTAEALVSMAGF